MGYFSWRCASSGKPVVATGVGWPDDLKSYSKVVLVTRKGWFKGEYDGYGRIELEELGGGAQEHELPDSLGEMRTVKLVLASEFKGQAYADLPDSEDEPNQGYFWDEDDLRDVVNDLLPYPREAPGRAGPEVLKGTPAGALLETPIRDEFARRDRLAQLAVLLSAADAYARADGKSPKDDPFCVSLRQGRGTLKHASLSLGDDISATVPAGTTLVIHAPDRDLYLVSDGRLATLSLDEDGGRPLEVFEVERRDGASAKTGGPSEVLVEDGGSVDVEFASTRLRISVSGDEIAFEHVGPNAPRAVVVDMASNFYAPCP